MSRGTLEFVVIEFPGPVPGRTLAPELTALVEKGVIKVIDILFVTKDAAGEVSSFEIADRDGDGEYEALDMAVESIDGLIADQDVAMIGQALDPGSTAMILLFEHLWMKGVRQAVLGAGGE